MKEENKKKTVKKTTTKKTNTAVKKTASKATPKKATSAKTKAATKTTKTVKKAAPKTVAKKTTPVKKSTVTVKKSVEVKPVNVEVSPKAEVKEDTLNRDLVLRSIILVSYTLIIVFLIIGFVDYMLKVRVSFSQTNVTSYVETSNYFAKSNVIDLEDANFKLSALTGDYFVYISYGDNNVNLFERQLISLLNSKNLKHKFYYINIDEIKDEENVVNLVNRYLGYKDALISKVPTILYVNSENILRVENIITRTDDKIMDINDVQSLLDRNGF